MCGDSAPLIRPNQCHAGTTGPLEAALVTRGPPAGTGPSPEPQSAIETKTAAAIDAAAAAESPARRFPMLCSPLICFGISGVQTAQHLTGRSEPLRPKHRRLRADRKRCACGGESFLERTCFRRTLLHRIKPESGPIGSPICRGARVRTEGHEE
ncbi:hypothetical protein EYF80_020776 [Liparis tanakae]|uniref:Uncharacterized protein n=1 Tax=Liparis tanakae TaxID=230148 RepID=A0A4Z2HUB7_9TELE|nr:hypothetical protein EYF80_020776 [Liparis tanakae]